MSTISNSRGDDDAITFHPQTIDPRRAGEVTRYHTWSRLREQSVGEHCWQVARILMAILPPEADPKITLRMLIWAQVHDVGEVAAGDPPYPSKTLCTAFREGHRRVERAAHLAMVLPWALPSPPPLGLTEERICKLAEIIEYWEWGLGEVELGNRRAVLVAQRGRENLDATLRELDALTRTGDAWVTAILVNARRYMDRRCDAHDRVMSEMDPT